MCRIEGRLRKSHASPVDVFFNAIDHLSSGQTQSSDASFAPNEREKMIVPADAEIV
jgi:hypothetical protein